MRTGIVVPVYNEKKYLEAVIREVLEINIDKKVFLVDDGSDQETRNIIKKIKNIEVITHKTNQGYGAALISGFKKAIEQNCDFIITIDADRQHLPHRIPEFLKYIKEYDIVSGSRYHRNAKILTPPPSERKYVNFLIQRVLFYLTGIKITDAFCGFRAYKREFLKDIDLKEKGYAFPLEMWYYVYKKKARLKEIPCELYYPEKKDFPGNIKNKKQRLAYYKSVLENLFKRNLEEIFSRAKKEIEDEYFSD
jgi:dolichol-phosphate mannosyltransferase